jgi:hypothetical protein
MAAENFAKFSRNFQRSWVCVELNGHVNGVTNGDPCSLPQFLPDRNA